jgi:hypothetical protein
METELDKTLADLKAEILRARAKHPKNRMLVEALLEEIGEAVNEWAVEGCLAWQKYGLDYPPYPEALRIGNTEWLQVACVAIRLFEEGTPLTQSSRDLNDQLFTLGNRAHTILKAAGVPD